MKRYLNKQTRRDAMVTAGMINELKDISDRWNDYMKNPPKRVTRFMKTAASFLACAMRELDKDLDNYEVSRIYRMAETTRFEISYAKFDLSSKTPETVTYDITEEERDNIVEALWEVRCNGCNGCKKDCTVRDQFFKWDVTPIHEVTDKVHPCQYMMADEV
jgi:hypothetical protein